MIISNMNVILSLIKINIYKVLLIPLNLIMYFLPLVVNYNPVLFSIEGEFVDLLGLYIVTNTLILVLQIIFIKRYSKIGRIVINEEKIEIEEENGTKINIIPSKNINIIIEYNGYKGEETGEIFPLYTYQIKSGIGKLEIVENGKYKEFKFVSEKNYLKLLEEIIEHHNKDGYYIDLRKG